MHEKVQRRKLFIVLHAIRFTENTNKIIVLICMQTGALRSTNTIFVLLCLQTGALISTKETIVPN